MPDAVHRFDLDRIGAGLPVDASRAALQDAASSGAMVVTAPPGTGKTTLLPPLVANRTEGITLVTQPRRVAVRAAARRIAALDGSPLGEQVGFTVRGQRELSAGARIEVITPGVLLRRLLDDPELPGVGAVLLDEVHERSLDTDLLLGMLAEVRTLREDLLVGAMSATLDAQGISALLDGAAVVEVPGVLHPLEVRYAPPPGPRLDARGVTRDFLDHLADVALRAHRDGDGDALVFVPGAREVDELVRRLRDRSTGIEVLPLHGRLPASAQDRATGGRGEGDPPRIVVSTVLAESSLTVPGVRVVVDAGLDRQVRRDRGRDMSGLVTVSASRASAEQRAGRAARQGPGLAVRAYAESDLARMPAHAPAEITSVDLTDAMLQLACWGTPRGEGLALLTPPPRIEVEAAESTLHDLGLIDEDGLATPLGREVALLPVGVREARALLEGVRRLPGQERLVAQAVAALSGEHRADGADLPALLRSLRGARGGARSNGSSRDGGPSHTAGYPRDSRGADGAGRWRREAERLERIARGRAGTRPSAAAAASGEVPPSDDSLPAASGGAASGGARSRGAGSPGADPAEEATRVGLVLALARPERIARRIASGSRTLLLASGTRAALPEGSSLTGHDWFAVWEVQRAEGRAADGTGAVVRLAAPLAEADALDVGAPLLCTERTARWEGDALTVREEKRLGAIVLSSTPVRARTEDAVPALLSRAREDGVDALPWSESAAVLRRRLALLHRELGAPWPDVSSAALAGDLSSWLEPAAVAAGGRVDRLDLLGALRGMLPWPEASRLDELAPERLDVPSGSSARIDYPEPDDVDGSPVVAVKLQELFGLAETPQLVDGRVPVLCHLLSPARRPLAVTADLRSFWNGPYQEVRKEMRGRYPKHPWPEDPWTAQATARTTRRMQQG